MITVNQQNKIMMIDHLIGKKCIVRTYSAGVFFGELVSYKKQEGLVKNARRIWYWDGASTLSELATKGVSRPDNCKFPCAVPEVFLSEIIEIIPCTEEAIKSIEGVWIWTQH